MDPQIHEKIAQLEAKIDKIYTSVEKTRKYFLWTTIVTLSLFILPLVALAFVLPSFMTNYVDQLQVLSQ